jgi:signal transduction histidine kinase
LTMKNVSAYELDFDTGELFERFKRGDQSRSTEGSGLGLSIAKSIVTLQGGKLSIEIDGDLFKVIIEFDN